MWNDRLDVTADPTIFGKVVTATITLTAVLIIYDGWVNLSVIGAAGVIAGPVFAIVVAHIFSSGLVQVVELARPMTKREWFSMARYESRLLLLAVPPLLILFTLDLAGVQLADTIRVIISFEALSLTFWAVLSAYRAGLRGRSLVLAGLAGLAMTAIVIALQVLLRPGDTQDGVATGGP